MGHPGAPAAYAVAMAVAGPALRGTLAVRAKALVVAGDIPAALETLAGVDDLPHAARAQWVRSYVTDDHIYCFHPAEDEDTVREHAAGGGFPAAKVSVVRRVIDPMTAEDGA